MQQGEARAADGGNLLYREQHLIRRDGDRIRERLVLYRCADGTAFARKHVDYGTSRFAPDFSLTDARGGYREGLEHAADGYQAWSGVSATPEPLAKHDGVLVADAGFDEFVRAHWSQLQDGKLPIRFVVPAYHRSLGFNVRGLGQSSIDGEAVQRFSLKLGGVLSLVSPQIEADYGAADHRLRRFKGISNLRDDRGKLLMVRIDFPQPEKVTDASQWQAMQALPLQRCAIGS